ncbi:MAG TPA: hypothetical protein VF351_02190 [Actinomycetota bacterium]
MTGRLPAPRWSVDVVVCASACLAIVALYIVAFGSAVHLIGADQFGYAWQFRAVRGGFLDSIDARPGTMAMGAALQGIGVVPGSLAPPLVAVALCAALGLVVAALVRSALALPAWMVLPIAIGTATFGGTSRLTGYVANMTALVCFSAGVAVIVRRRSPTRSSVAVGAGAFLAAGLAHPGILPAWFAIVVAWLGLSCAWWVAGRARRSAGAGAMPFDVRPAVTLAALTLGAVGSIGLVLGVLHRSLDELGDLTLVQGFFVERLGETWRWVAPTVPFAVAGIVAAALRGLFRGDRETQRMLIAWTAVCLGGVAVMVVASDFPGHRTLMLAVPIGAATGLSAAAMGTLAGRYVKGDRRTVLGTRVVVAVGASLVIGFLGLTGFRSMAATPWSDRASPARKVAAVAAQLPADVPVVMVFEPRHVAGALLWKVRLNIARSFLDARRATQLVMYVGDPQRLLQGSPTTSPPDADELQRVVGSISSRTWQDVSAAQLEGAVTVVARQYVRTRSWGPLLTEGADLVDGDIAVLGSGAVETISEPVHASMSRLGGWVSASITVVVLGIAGVGLAGLGVGAGSSVLSDVATLAPAFGTVVVVLLGTTAALVGVDPGGAVGLGALIVIAFVGARAAAGKSPGGGAISRRAGTAAKGWVSP